MWPIITGIDIISIIQGTIANISIPVPWTVPATISSLINWYKNGKCIKLNPIKIINKIKPLWYNNHGGFIMYIDSHCHLSKEYYESLDEIINKAKENNVKIVPIDSEHSAIFQCLEKDNEINKEDQKHVRSWYSSK